MCSPAPCQTCGKTTWKGCGEHIDQVRAVVAQDQWCAGHGDRPGLVPLDGDPARR